MDGGRRLTPRRNNLHKEIVEQIVGMMPFPSIFKGRCLSKSWLGRFGSISPEAYEEEKRLAISFQKQVREWSNSWKTLCPMFAKNKQDFIAYDRISHKWRRLPSLPFIPEADLGIEKLEVQIEGALLHASSPNSIQSKKYVANILTGAWKQLRACPHADLTVLREKLVSCASSEMYKVIILCGYGSVHDIDQDKIYLQIYNSKPDAWSIKKVVFSFDLKSKSFSKYVIDECAVYLNGILYIFTVEESLAFNVEEGTLEKLNMRSGKLGNCCTNALKMTASWNGNLLIVLVEYKDFRFESALKVLKFDLQSEDVSVLAGWSFPALEISWFAQPFKPVFDGHCIYFGVERCGTRILTYNVDKNEWIYFPIPALKSDDEWDFSLLQSGHIIDKDKWVGCVFQPGLNPFAAV